MSVDIDRSKHAFQLRPYSTNAFCLRLACAHVPLDDFLLKQAKHEKKHALPIAYTPGIGGYCMYSGWASVCLMYS